MEVIHVVQYVGIPTSVSCVSRRLYRLLYIPSCFRLLYTAILTLTNPGYIQFMCVILLHGSSPFPQSMPTMSFHACGSPFFLVLFFIFYFLVEDRLPLVYLFSIQPDNVKVWVVRSLRRTVLTLCSFALFCGGISGVGLRSHAGPLRLLGTRTAPSCQIPYIIELMADHYLA